MWRARFPAAQVNRGDRAPHSCAVGDAAQEKRQRDVLLHAELRQHVERLEHEAEAIAPQACEIVVVELFNLTVLEGNGA